MPKPSPYERSTCPVAVTLDIIGDKWTLLVIRDLLLGARRYNDFLKSPEGIPTNILAERLKRLESHELVNKKTYQTRPPRYEYRLTKKGEALKPVIIKIIDWAKLYYPRAQPVSKKDSPFNKKQPS